jgi:hypothetical protein
MSAAPDPETVRDIACIRMHLEIAEVSARTRSLMPSLVNFRDALSRLAVIETKLAMQSGDDLDTGSHDMSGPRGLDIIDIRHEFAIGARVRLRRKRRRHEKSRKDDPIGVVHSVSRGDGDHLMIEVQWPRYRVWCDAFELEPYHE